MKILGVHLVPHDCGFVIINDNKVKYFFEAEKYFKIKYFEVKHWTEDIINKFIEKIIEVENDFDYICVSPNYLMAKEKRFFSKHLFDKYFLNGKIKYKEVKYYSHHLCHGASSYYTSNFNDSLIISLDGGSDGSIEFNHGGIFHGKDNNIKEIDKIEFPLGNHFSKVSFKVLEKINPEYVEGINHKGHVAGKFMAYCSYGKYNDKYLNIINLILNSNPFIMGDKINKRIIDIVDTYIVKRVKNLKDFSYTFQVEWIKRIILLIKKYSYLSNNICLSGGSFLNVMLNYKLIKSGMFEHYHFTPYPSDVGQCLGAALNCYKNKISIPITGPELNGNSNKPNEPLNLDKLIDELINKKIVGLIQGEIEIGPRSLGNRSIICDPRNKEMKDILNKRVKHREEFRPFGIMILKDDLSKYFDIEGDFPYMNIVGYNKTDLFKAVKHIDNTTRIQTITKDNIFIYKLLKKFKERTGIPCLLNTSFNIKGQTIINWYEDAFEMLDNNKIDLLVINKNTYYKED